MKNENKKGWVSRFAYTAIVIALSQVFIACGGKGGGNSPTVTPLPIPPGNGINSFNAANCGSGTGGIIACAIGTSPGIEVLLQVSSPTGQATYGGINAYSGPALVNGVVNILPGYGGCATVTSYSFTGTLNYFGAYLNNFEGTVAATGGTGAMQISFADPFLTAGGGVSSQGQSFAYRLVGQIYVQSSATGVGYPYGGTQSQCYVPTGGYVLN